MLSVQPDYLKSNGKSDQFSDVDLVHKFKNGDKTMAFNMLIRRHHERVYWTIKRIVGEHDAADDAAQETFITVWKKLDQFREDAQFSTWLYRVAVNEGLRHIRRQKSRRHFDKLDADHHTVVDKNAAADKSLLHHEKISAVERAIDQLPPQQRTVFCMRYYGGLKYDEIADIMSRSPGTLKAHYHFAIKKLGKLMTKEFAITGS